MWPRRGLKPNLSSASLPWGTSRLSWTGTGIGTGIDSDHPAAALLATRPARGGAAVGSPYSLVGALRHRWGCGSVSAGCHRPVLPVLQGRPENPVFVAASHPCPVALGFVVHCSVPRLRRTCRVGGAQVGFRKPDAGRLTLLGGLEGSRCLEPGWDRESSLAGDTSPLPAVPCALPRPVPLAWQTLGMAPHLPLPKKTHKNPNNQACPLTGCHWLLNGCLHPPVTRGCRALWRLQPLFLPLLKFHYSHTGTHTQYKS